jgi:hypothetical protein
LNAQRLSALAVSKDIRLKYRSNFLLIRSEPEGITSPEQRDMV